LLHEKITKGVERMLGARIAALRRNQGLSQAELAHRLGISPSAVGMYEQGRREPSVELLVALATEFQVSTDYLLTGKPGPGEESYVLTLLHTRLDAVQNQSRRRSEPLSKQEIAVLLAALLMES
jgi:transcriptional regulator with XRE-family HTH domain